MNFKTLDVRFPVEFALGVETFTAGGEVVTTAVVVGIGVDAVVAASVVATAVDVVVVTAAVVG